MKMKKLTALALAGVLCLGMSTTVFAGPSVTPGVAHDTIVDAEGKEVDNEDVGEFEVTNTGVIPKDVKDQIADWEKHNLLLENAVKDYAEAADIELKSDSKYAVVGSGNYETDLDWDMLDEGQELAVYFDVTDLKIDKKNTLKKGDTLYLMHWVDTAGKNGDWVLMETELIEDPVTGALRAKALFNAEDKLSPIVFIARQNAKGGTTVTPVDPTDPIVPNPSDPSDPSNPSVDNGGKITIDDIANAVVKKLQATNTRVVRVNTGVSPKTGE